MNFPAVGMVLLMFPDGRLALAALAAGRLGVVAVAGRLGAAADDPPRVELAGGRQLEHLDSLTAQAIMGLGLGLTGSAGLRPLLGWCGRLQA